MIRKIRALLIRAAGLLRRRKADDDFLSELESHLALDIEDGMRSGLSKADARRRALIRLGGVEQGRQAYRERTGLPFIEAILHDVCYALRGLRRNPAFALTAILT